MIEKTSTSVKFLAFYTASKQGSTGLTVTVDVYDPSGTKIVDAVSASELAGGLYTYTLSSSNSSAGEYVAIFKTTDANVDAQHVPSLWSLGRAGVENLDASVSSRLADADYTAPTAAPTVVDIRTEMDSNSTKLANLDATISSRLADADYTAPTTPPTAAEIAAAVEGSLLNEGDGQAVLNAIVGAIGNSNVDEIALVAAIRSDLERAGGKLDNIPATAAPTASAVASATRAELATELGRIDAAISTRSTLATGDIQSADITAIKAKTDLLNTDRLANVATTNIVGTLLAQANS